MVKATVVKVVISLICVICMHPTSVMMQEEGIAARVVDFVEKNFVRVFLQDCTNIKNFLRLNYDQTSAETSSRLSTVSLVFYGKKNHTIFSLSDASTSIYSSSGYNNTIPMTIIIHGHSNNPFSSEISPLIDDLKQIKTSNIFALNYGRLMLDNYYAASTHVRFVGDALGKILAKLYFKGIKHVHLIGHSLGAHVSGFAGKTLKKLTGYKIDRITGLDPAGPCFFKTSPENRLSKSDAQFVDVIHTDINTSGFPEQLGHVDFYPNGGDNMPGCLLGTCSHVLSIDYYRASVNYPKIFAAIKCNEWSDFKKGYCDRNSKILMGHWLNNSGENGKYYLETSSNFPYGLENIGIKMTKSKK